MSVTPPFHLALPVHDLAEARRFYGALLDCAEGRSAERWVDFDFFGHQLSVHLAERSCVPRADNPVDGHTIPVPHFGVVLEPHAWKQLRARLESAGTAFVVPPHTRFAGEAGEQSTLFVSDPSGNVLEFKAFGDPGRLFAR